MVMQANEKVSFFESVGTVLKLIYGGVVIIAVATLFFIILWNLPMVSYARSVITKSPDYYENSVDFNLTRTVDWDIKPYSIELDVPEDRTLPFKAAGACETKSGDERSFTVEFIEDGYFWLRFDGENYRYKFKT